MEKKIELKGAQFVPDEADNKARHGFDDGLLMKGREKTITAEEALDILTTTSHDKCCSFLPEKPRGGDVYIFKPRSLDCIEDWKNDGYKWKNQGTTRLPRNRTPLIQKKYFYGILKDGSTDHSKRKAVFCREDGTDPDYLALIHYVGVGETEPDAESEVVMECINEGEDGGSGEPTDNIQMKASDSVDLNPSEMTKTPSVETSAPSTPDLATAMETMKAALAAKQKGTPVMEMFNTLFESVCSNLENPDMEYCLVVSDKKSGKKSLIGTKGGKELASKTPELTGKSTGNGSKADDRINKGNRLTEEILVETDNIPDHNGMDNAFEAQVEVFDNSASKKGSKSKSKSFKVDENKSKLSEEKKGPQNRKSGNQIKVETSVRATRNIKTPNWKVVLSGKGSDTRDSSETSSKCVSKDRIDGKPPEKTTRKLEKDVQYNRIGGKDSKDSKSITSKLKQCTIKLLDVKKKSATGVSFGNENSRKSTEKVSEFHESLKLSPRKDVNDMQIRKGTRRKTPSCKLRGFETETPKVSKLQINSGQSYESKAQNDNVKFDKTVSEKATNDNKIKSDSLGKAHSVKEKEIKKMEKATSPGDSKRQAVKKAAEISTSKSKGKGRPKGSKNKTLEDEDNDFEAKIEVLSYTGHSGRPKRTSMKVKIEPEVMEVEQKLKIEHVDVEKLPKRKSQKSTSFDTVSVDSVNLSDDEDILEWKGVGEMKNGKRGRPKGSALQKYVIITVPEESKENQKDTGTDKEKPEAFQMEENKQGSRTSSRIAFHSCEICAKQFSLKYLLDEHYLTEHPNVSVKTEPDEKQVERRGRKRKNAEKELDNDTCCKHPKLDLESDGKEILDIESNEIADEKKDALEDGEQDDPEDEDWEASESEGDDDDDYQVSKSRAVNDRKMKTESKENEYLCTYCHQKFKSLVSLQVHKIVHMKKDLAFECFTCKQKFLTQNDLQFHSRTAHKVDYGTLMYFGFVLVDSKIRCEICSEDFESMEAYHDHRPEHLTLKFLCRTCGHGFESSDDLGKHTLSKCTEAKFHLKCEACHTAFSNFETRKKHIKSVHAKSSDLICHLCGLLKDDLESLKEHINSHTSEKIFQCESCDKSFTDKKNLMDHRLIHSRSQEMECPTCFKTLACQKSLLKHMHLHTIKKKFFCKLCDQKFDSKQACVEHEKTHGGSQENEPQEHKCEDCGRIFGNKYRLQRHMQVHFEEKCFECVFCQERFQTGSSLLVHKKTKHPELYKLKKQPRIHICEYCGFKTTHKQRLIRHMQVHNAEKLFECEFCHKKFQTMTSCSSHKMIHRGRVREPSKKFFCKWSHCHKEFIKPATLRRHLNSHLFKVVSGREDCDCQDCAVKQTGGAIHGSSVDNLEQIGSEVVLEGANNKPGQEKDQLLHRHRQQGTPSSSGVEPNIDSMDILQEAISQIEEAESSEIMKDDKSGVGTVLEELTVQNFPCPWCPATFSLRCKLVEHFDENHERQKFPTCDVCNKVYLDKKNLREHKTVHTGVKPHACESCGRVFRTKTALRQHSHIHSEIKPYVCSYCGHGFTQRGYFLEHVRRHTGERPYVCNICKKSFVSNDAKKRHMYSHTGNKPFQCNQCGKSFIEKSLFTIHLRTHDNYRPFQCGVCDKTFFANAKLQRHLATVHHMDKRTLSDYAPTKVSKGFGWRLKSNTNKEKIKPETQYVVFIDQHGNVISRVDTRAAEHPNIAPHPEPVDACEENVDDETQTQEEEILERQLAEAEQIAIKQEQEAQCQNIQILNKLEEGYIPIDSAIEVHTKRDGSGQLQIYAIPQEPGNNSTAVNAVDTEFTAAELVAGSSGIQDLTGPVEVFELAPGQSSADPMEVVQLQTDSQEAVPVKLIEMPTSENNEVSAEGTQYAAVVEGGENTVQHIELITQAITEQQGVENQQDPVQIVSGLKDENSVDYDNQSQVESSTEGVEQLGGDISINIGEDGTVNIADLEKIEALRNLYSDQQIVIVLENQNQ